VDVGASWVDYEGFLGSGAASVTPILRYEAPNLSVGASGSLVVFESGSRIFQGLAAGGWRTHLAGPFRGEISGSIGISKYSATISDTAGSSEPESYPSYGHGLARGRLHLTGTRSGVWIGVASGRSFIGDSGTTPYEIEVGVWTVRNRIVANATLTRTWFASAAYLDGAASVRWRDAPFELSGSVGFRTWSEGGGRGVWGELRAEIPVWKRLLALVSGGRYPSDPVRGVIAANYVTVGFRLNLLRAPAPVPLSLPRSIFASFEEPTSPFVGEARLEIASSSGDTRLLRVRAAGAESVVITGDFTDWQPVPLLRVTHDRWEVTWRIPPGIHRVNLRVNGGAWMVPLGLRVQEDEFGGAVGILVVN